MSEKFPTVSHKHFTGRSIPKRQSRMSAKQSRAIGKKHCILVWQDAHADNSAWKRLIKVLRIITNNVNNMEWTTEKHLVRNDDGVHYYMIPLGEKHCNPQTQLPWRWMDYIALLKSFGIETTLFYTTNGRIAWQGSGSGVNPVRTHSNIRNRHLYRENEKLLNEQSAMIHHNIRVSAYSILKKLHKESYVKRFRLSFDTAGLFARNESVLTSFQHLKQIFTDDNSLSKTMQRDYLVNAINAIEQAFADGDCDRLQAYGVDCIMPAMDNEQFADYIAETVTDKIRSLTERLETLLMPASNRTIDTSKDVSIGTQYHTPTYYDLPKHKIDWSNGEPIKLDMPILPIEATLGYNRVVPFDYVGGKTGERKRIVTLVMDKSIGRYVETIDYVDYSNDGLGI